MLAEVAALRARYDACVQDYNELREVLGTCRRERSAYVQSELTEVNGRFKKIEHVLFGNEETGQIGLGEKVREVEHSRDRGRVALAMISAASGALALKIIEVVGTWLFRVPKAGG